MEMSYSSIQMVRAERVCFVSSLLYIGCAFHEVVH